MTIERDKILSKIRGLLAKTLGAGATEPEAMAALEMAQNMMTAYEVTEAELNLTKEEKAIIRGEPKGTKDPHLIKWQLLLGVTKFCGCQGWRRAQIRSGGGGIVFCGLPSDAQFASWLLDSLANFVQNESRRRSRQLRTARVRPQCNPATETRLTTAREGNRGLHAR